MGISHRGCIFPKLQLRPATKPNPQHSCTVIGKCINIDINIDIMSWKDGQWEGRVFIVTGASSGLGFQTACDLIKKYKDICVVLPCRTWTKAKDTVERIVDAAMTPRPSPTSTLPMVSISVSDYISGYSYLV